jgi:uncharacterized membrane-anchored protein YjiN (DUF445 family)
MSNIKKKTNREEYGMDIQTMLNDEIVKEFEKLGGMNDIGDDKYRTAIDGITKLIDRAITMEKFNIESEDKLNAQNFEQEMRRKEMKDERIDRIVKNVLTGVSIVSGVGLTVWGTLKTFKFEETGTVTTMMGRGFINRLFGKK